MQAPALPENEVKRLQALQDCAILDTPPEERFDRLTRLAQHLFGTKIVLISLVDAERLWFKSKQGTELLETGRDISFCGHAILEKETLHIPDTQLDPRFADNPFVTGDPYIRFYAGAPLSTLDGYRIGTLCIIDDQPRQLSIQELSILRDLADCVEREISQHGALQHEAELRQAKQLSEAIARAQSHFIRAGERHKVFDGLLSDILSLSNSEYGFVGEILYTSDGDPYLKTYAITNIAWDESTRAFYDANAPKGMEFFNLNTLFGAVMTTGKPVISNDPAHDPRSGGLPKGHPPLNTFLGIPVHHGGKLVAMLGIANRSQGYTQNLVEFLHPLLVTLGQLINAARIQRLHHENEIELARLSQVASQTTNGVIITDVDGKVEWINSALTRITGYSLDDMRGKEPGKILQGAESDSKTIAIMRDAVHHGEAFDVDILNYTKTGQPFWINIICTPLRNASDELQGFIAIETDITERKKADEKLRSTSRILDSIVENVPNMIFLKRASDLCFEFFNRAGETLIGHDRSELVGRNDYDFFPKEQADFFTQKDRAVLAQQDVVDIPEETIETPRGTRILHTQKLALHNEQGKPEYLLGISEDITERKNSELALQHERDFTSALFSAAGALMLVLDRSGRIVRFNQTAEHITGYTFDEIKGKYVWELFILPDERTSVMSVFNNLTHGNVTTRYENHWLMRDGSQRLFDWSNAVLTNNQNEVEYIVTIGIDITEKKAAELALQRSEARLRGLFELSPVGIALNDYETGSFLELNDALLAPTGYTREEFTSLSYWDITPKEYHTHEAMQLESLDKTGRYGPYEKEYIRKDGSRYPVLLNGIMVYDTSGRKMIWSIIEDITERKRIDRMKNEFISIVSHELRTPLTSITGALGLISSGVTGDLPEQVQELITIAQKNSKRLSILINDLLDMEKLVVGKMSFKLQVQNLVQIVEQAIRDNKTYADQYNVKLEFNKDSDEIPVEIDSQRLHQVLSNLLSNASKFSPDNGVVNINIKQTGDMVRVEVIDNGPGIPASFRERLFEKFEQVDASDSRQKGGTGLGLAISRELMERMGGTINFESIEGEGATFYFELPIATG